MSDKETSTQGFLPPAGMALSLRALVREMDDALFFNRSDAAAHDATMRFLEMWPCGLSGVHDRMLVKGALWRVLVYADHHQWPDRDRLDAALAGNARTPPLFTRTEVFGLAMQRDMLKKPHDMLAHIRRWLAEDHDLALAEQIFERRDPT